jgi:hypothetical protein
VNLAELTVLRLLTPLLILRWQLTGLLLSMLLDVNDWNLLPLYTPEDHIRYQNWDRIMDMWIWLVALVMVRTWKDKASRNLAFGFFGFRMIGMIIFFLTQDRRFLFFFPNFFDNFLVMYLGYVRIFKRDILFETSLDALVILPLLIIPKTIHEYFLHYLQQQPWEIYNIARPLGITGVAEYPLNYLIWGGLFYILPFLAVFLYARYRLQGSVTRTTATL